MAAPPPIRRVESQLVAADSTPLLWRAWLPLDPVRDLLVVHGFAEHSGRYDHVGAWFARRRCAVHAFDLRGHGRSGGVRGHADGCGDFLDDVELALERVRREGSGRPLYVVGHSMGGLLVAALLRERKPDVAGAVLSGAALGAHERMPTLQVMLARAARRIAPKLGVDAKLPLDGLSRDPDVVRRYEDDPLVFRKGTVALFLTLYETARDTVDGGADVRVPALVLHGARDPICTPDASRRFHATLSAPGSELQILPDLRHEIFNEPEQEDVFGRVLDWLEAREA